MGVQSGVAIPHYFIYHEKRMMKSIEGEKKGGVAHSMVHYSGLIGVLIDGYKSH